MKKNQIIIFDTTLRDGEQSPGASMSLEEKIQIAKAFEDLGVDILVAGFLQLPKVILKRFQKVVKFYPKQFLVD